MALITAEAREELVALFIGMFKAVPGADNLSEIVAAAEAGASIGEIAATLATKAEFNEVFPGFLTGQEFADRLVENMLGEEVAAGPKEWATNWVLTNLNAGLTRAEVILTAVQAIRATPNAAYAAAQDMMENRVEVALYYSVEKGLSDDSISDLQGVIAAVTSDVATVDTAKTLVDEEDNEQNSLTLTLSTSATDVKVGGAAGDLIIGQLGQSTTLQASDTINGGPGTDTFRIVTDGAAAQSATGFTVINTEILEIQAQATGGTTLSLENVTGVNTISSVSSSGALVLNQVKAIADLSIANALGAQDVTVNYQAGATGGTNVQNLALNGSAVGTLTVGGVETLAVSTSSANSTVAGIVGAAFNTVTVAGDKSLTITAALPTTVKTVDASAQTAGGVSVTAGVADVAVTGGAGNDQVTFTGSFTAADSFNGGDGRDTIIANQAEFTAGTYAASAKISNVETVRIADALTAAFDASKIAGEDTYILAGGYSTSTISKVTDGSTIDVRGTGTGTLTVTIGDGATLATAVNTANTVTVAVGTPFSNTAANQGTINVDGVETLNLVSNGSATAGGGNTVTIVDPAATSLKVTGSEDLNLTLTGTALSTLDASGSSGINDFSLVTFKAATAATITGGTGVDKINGSGAGDTISGGTGADIIAGGGGADTLTGGDGIDTFAFNTVTDSSGAAQDTITDFVSGTDLINLQTLANATGRTNIVLRNGAAADFGTAQAAIAQTSGNTQVVFQVDTGTLWVDLNDDGTLNNNDLAVKLTGATAITAADVGGTSTPGGSGNFITLNAAGAVVNATTSTNATAVTTAFNDNIKGTIAQIDGLTTLDGLAGSDTLVVTDAGALAAIVAGVTNVEILQLASGGNTAAGFNAAGHFTTVTGGAGTDVITSTANLIQGGTVALGDGDDTITALTTFLTAQGGAASYKINVDMGVGTDMLTTTTALVFTADTVLNGGAGTGDTISLADTSDISLGSVSGFENLTTAATATMKIAQYTGFTGTVTNGGLITFNDAGAVTLAAAGNFTLANGTNTVTVGTGATGTLTGGTGADTFSGTSVQILATTAIVGGTGTDVVNINLNGAASTHNGATDAISGIESLVFTNSGTSAVLNLTATDAYATTTFTIDASALTSATTFVGTGLTKATSIKFGSGAETITNLNAGAAALTVDFGGGNATVTDFTDTGGTHAANTANVTLKFGTSVATQTVNFAATAEDFLAGDIFDFATNVTSVVNGAANGTLGVAGANGQVFIDDQGADVVVTFDADGSRTFSAGDVQIVLTGQTALAGGIDASGNLLIA